MSNLMPVISAQEIRKGLNLLGLNLSDSELYEAQIGDTILLENRTLNEIGSVFILASALASASVGQKNITFQDLNKGIIDSNNGSHGIPIYCWQDNLHHQYCIYLALIQGKLAIRTCPCLIPE